MKKRIILFTLDGCYYCQSLKDKLNELSIPFDEFEINQHPHIWNNLVKEIKHEILPTIIISDVDVNNAMAYIPTIDYQSEEEIVEIIVKEWG